MALTHFSHIDIKSKVAERIAQIEDELARLQDAGALRISINAETLFYFEALGYLVDFTTGEASPEDLSSKSIPF